MDFPADRLDLYLIEIGEPSDNQLRVVICEAFPDVETEIDEGDFKIDGVRPIEVTEDSRFFELYWTNYVSYAVRNESYWAREEGEPEYGGNLSQRTNSAFLRYVAATTFADDDYPGPLEHWALITLNHCLDVVSTEPPEISPIEAVNVVRRPTAINFSKR